MTVEDLAIALLRGFRHFATVIEQALAKAEERKDNVRQDKAPTENK